jgi:hypothetical protein
MNDDACGQEAHQLETKSVHDRYADIRAARQPALLIGALLCSFVAKGTELLRLLTESLYAGFI